MTIFDGVNPILAALLDMCHRELLPIAGIPNLVYRVSIPIPMGVIPDIFNRESILDLYRWIPATNCGYDGRGLST